MSHVSTYTAPNAVPSRMVPTRILATNTLEGGNREWAVAETYSAVTTSLPSVIYDRSDLDLNEVNNAWQMIFPSTITHTRLVIADNAEGVGSALALEATLIVLRTPSFIAWRNTRFQTQVNGEYIEGRQTTGV